jgi:putative NIF3 family GTP cyclohydrolase 1 type 2
MWQYYLISRHFNQDRMREAANDRMAAEARLARSTRRGGDTGWLGRLRGRRRSD